MITKVKQMKDMTGAEIIIQSLIDMGVDVIFGYPGGGNMPIYDALYDQKKIKHILVRHEQAAVHAAEGYARSTGKLGVVLVTSGPGATNTVTGIADAMLDSTPIVCITTQVMSHFIGTDAFQEVDMIGISRSISKHSYLIKNVKKITSSFQEAFHLAISGRPGPVVIDVPKDIQIAKAPYEMKEFKVRKSYSLQIKGDEQKIAKAVDLMLQAERPVFYCGGGIISSDAKTSVKLTELVRDTGFPITLTLMGLGAYPSPDKQNLGMLGMHGTYEANMAMHDCDLIICVGARFDDRVTSVVDKFSPNSKKIHVDIDPSSINKNVAIDVDIVGDAYSVLNDIKTLWDKKKKLIAKKNLTKWWDQINEWQKKDCLCYKKSTDIIKPQYVIERLYELIKDKNPFITTDVGQHQMWTAQYYKFNQPRHFLTSGGLGTMGFGVPAAIGAQIAHPDSLVVCISSEGSFMMNMQEIATAVQYQLPIKVIILNNRYLGLVRQWQELFFNKRYSQTYFETLPDFVKLAEAFDAAGILVEKPEQLDDALQQMLSTKKPVIMSVTVDQYENVLPIIPSGKAPNEMLLRVMNND